MHIQILSDLHLEMECPGYPPGRETYDYDFPMQALALLGDIGCTLDERLFDWLRAQLRRFKVILYVMSNHGALSQCASVNLRAHNPVVHRAGTSRLSLPRTRTEHPIDRVPRPSQSPDLGRFAFLNHTGVGLSPSLTVIGCTLRAADLPA
jgi:hypothetical protein